MDLPVTGNKQLKQDVMKYCKTIKYYNIEQFDKKTTYINEKV